MRFLRVLVRSFEENVFPGLASFLKNLLCSLIFPASRELKPILLTGAKNSWPKRLQNYSTAPEREPGGSGISKVSGFQKAVWELYTWLCSR